MKKTLQRHIAESSPPLISFCCFSRVRRWICVHHFSIKFHSGPNEALFCRLLFFSFLCISLFTYSSVCAVYKHVPQASNTCMFTCRDARCASVYCKSACLPSRTCVCLCLYCALLPALHLSNYAQSKETMRQFNLL